jgi:hypothetical protein
MSYSAHHRSHRDACSPEARGSGVRAGRDPQAATSGQAATTTHTPDHHRAAYPPEPGQTRSAGTAAVAETSKAHSEYGGVSVAVPEPSPFDPRSDHDGLPGQRLIARSRCR